MDLGLDRLRNIIIWLVGVLCVLGSSAAFAEKPLTGVDQLVVTVCQDWSSSEGRMQLFERDAAGNWVPALTEEVPVMLGRNGLAWGKGELEIDPEDAPVKREGDRRAPAGLFALGKIFGYASQLPEESQMSYHQVGKWDAWVDDPNNPYYNQHVVVDPDLGIPHWFEDQKMRHGDFAYTWLVEIRHNAKSPVPGAGSAIFFHVRRGEGRTTAGCTTMEEHKLVSMIRWLKEDANPHYVILPINEYHRRRIEWGLP